MRKYIFTIVFMLLGLTTSFAQKVSVPEPEFADQTYLLTSDTEYQKLPRESGVIKTKAGASLYIVGIGKVKILKHCSEFVQLYWLSYCW